VVLDLLVRGVLVEDRRDPAGAGAARDAGAAERLVMDGGQVPSRVAPRRIVATIDGALPVQRCSSRRSSISLTGAPACLASRHATTANWLPAGRGRQLAAEAAAHVLDEHLHVLAIDLERVRHPVAHR
jgi:hypothetical protein